MMSDEVPCRDTDVPEGRTMSGLEQSPAAAGLPTAFTINFGQEGEDKKLLSIKDGIRRFAPSKRPRERPSTAPAEAPTKALSPAPPPPPPVNPIEAPAEDKGDECSDAGTYTIDDDEEEVLSEKVESVFSVESANTHEWVSQWASASRSGFESFESPSSSFDEGSRSRRKLPPTPSIDARPADTENFLRDTISVMEAMEARIGVEKKAVRKKVVEQQARSLHRKSSASDRKLTSQESVSDETCSEVEQHSLQQQTVTQRTKCLPSTRPNRAFALRKKLNSSEEVPQGANISRGDGGRFSLRGTKASTGTSSSVTRSSTKVSTMSFSRTDKLAAASPRRTLVSKTVSDAATAARSSSSLSSKEAEFQAWKRRKNYNPLVASGLSNSQKHSPAVAVVRPAEKKRVVPTHNGVTADVASSSTMQRSASFHYPDGMSRVQHNVYSSEDESPDDHHGSSLSWERSDHLFELNDDELILPIGGRYHHRSRPLQQAARRTSPGRMEALDNLVISTIFSISTKLCLNSASMIRRAQERTANNDQHAIMDTLLYVLEDTDLPASPSKKTSRELAGTLRNLKKVEQALQVFEGSCFDSEEAFEEGEDNK